jgi:hypothetical protein
MDTAAAISFDHDRHEYRLSGLRVPSVTQVLGDIVPGWQADAWYLERGTAVHACAAMIARGEDFDFDPQISGQVAAIRRFFKEVCPNVFAVEKMVYSRRYLYAGTFDLSAIVGRRFLLIDWKASIGPAVRWQLAAYSLAYRECSKTGNVPRHGCAVQINDDGTYKMGEVYDLKRLENEWLAMRTVYGIREKLKLTKEEK